MNVTLIYPLLSKKRSKIDENKQYWPPLGLAYIAAMLEKAGHMVQIIDRDVLLRKNGMDFDRADLLMLEKIKGFESHVIGISATTPNMSDAGHISQYIKKGSRDTLIVLGGPHPSGEPILSLEENDSIDIAVKGEGELTMCDIAEGMPLEKIEGITYRKDGKIISNLDRAPIKDIDELPMPARHLLDMRFYTRPSRFTSRNLSLKTTSIFTARGCPYRCNFCAGPLTFHGSVRFHSASRVISEIEELISKYSIEALYFAEDMFLSSKRRAEELLNLFIEKGINKRVRWFAQAKANIITEEMLALMKEAGCSGIEYGFESGSQRVLDLMNKTLNVEESIRAADLTRRARLRFQANIIVGYPGEREEDFRKTIEFIKRIKPSMIGFNIFMPLPGTSSYEKLKQEGRPIPRWDDIGDQEAPQINYADMPKGLFEKLYLRARLEVILPMNLFAFLMDNINSPFRLLKLFFTQFRGVLIKTFRAVVQLISHDGNIILRGKTKVLFLSYNGLLEPILPSQAIPYMTELAKKDFEYILLTYEKKRDLKRIGSSGLKKLKDELKSHDIEWHYLRYHKHPPLLSTLFDLFIGTIFSFRLISTRRVKIVHVRGITPGVMMIFLSTALKWVPALMPKGWVKMLFDSRGLLAEEYVGGGIWSENSISFKIAKKAEMHMLRIADAVTVLTKKHLDLNRSLNHLKARKMLMDVVPCCVDINRFNHDADEERRVKKALDLEGKFILMYPGKIGTFYLMREMLDFYRAMLELVPTAIFFILASGDERLIFQLADAAGVGKDRLKVSRAVPFDQMPQYVRIADAGIFFINPYKKFGSSPIKMGEFLASGIPVIINPGIGDTEDIVGENRVGVTVKGFREGDYRTAINELFKLKEEGEVLRMRCRETAKRHLSLGRGVEKYYKIYKALTD